jgi:hypothetical protein
MKIGVLGKGMGEGSQVAMLGDRSHELIIGTRGIERS